uniref:Protein kinase domain-containing protein n=1 Tax=Oryza nivara TaxID=4536 RepID=A0A0E0FWN1_ORYNI
MSSSLSFPSSSPSLSLISLSGAAVVAVGTTGAAAASGGGARACPEPGDLVHRPPHGNLKSSNVLVVFPAPGSGGDVVPVAKLIDHGFYPLLLHHGHRLAAAKCSEFTCGRRLSSHADVFCLGLVLLEVVTGKVPVDEDDDLAEWAQLALSHEWSTDILDVEIVTDRDRHGDMLRLTEVALLCTAVKPEHWPTSAPSHRYRRCSQPPRPHRHSRRSRPPSSPLPTTTAAAPDRRHRRFDQKGWERDKGERKTGGRREGEEG